MGTENKYGNSGSTVYLDGAGDPPAPSWPNPPYYKVDAFSTPGAPGETQAFSLSAEGVRTGRWRNCVEMTSDQFQGANIMCFQGRVKP